MARNSSSLLRRAFSACLRRRLDGVGPDGPGRGVQAFVAGHALAGEEHAAVVELHDFGLGRREEGGVVAAQDFGFRAAEEFAEGTVHGQVDRGGVLEGDGVAHGVDHGPAQNALALDFGLGAAGFGDVVDDAEQEAAVLDLHRAGQNLHAAGAAPAGVVQGLDPAAAVAHEALDGSADLLQGRGGDVPDREAAALLLAEAVEFVGRAVGPDHGPALGIDEGHGRGVGVEKGPEQGEVGAVSLDQELHELHLVRVRSVGVAHRYVFRLHLTPCPQGSGKTRVGRQVLKPAGRWRRPTPSWNVRPEATPR